MFDQVPLSFWRKSIRDSFLFFLSVMGYVVLLYISGQMAMPANVNEQEYYNRYVSFYIESAGDIGFRVDIDFPPYDQDAEAGRVPLGYGWIGALWTPIRLSSYLNLNRSRVIDAAVGERVELVVAILPLGNIEVTDDVWNYLGSPVEVAQLVSPNFETTSNRLSVQEFFAFPSQEKVFIDQSLLILWSTLTALRYGLIALALLFLLFLMARLYVLHKRISRGACTHCGYPAAPNGQARCPECGVESRRPALA